MAQGLRPLWLSEGLGQHQSLHTSINLFINWLQGLTLTPWFNKAIMGYARPLWDMLGHYGFY